ncbi:MAG TPA: DinB family protein [Gemmatimonadales bacterium]|nr:DinB family protein [Gemmatimonadales bacterium]
MSGAATVKTALPPKLDPRIAARLLEEGYGPGAWHGPDLKAALADVSSQAAFRRPGAGRHNVAEIALHHAWCVRSVAGQLSGKAAAPFPLEGADWFELPDERRLSWTAILAILEEQQRGLAAVVADIGSGRIKSPLPEPERFDLVLGITCHAVYHAGQVQLVKVLTAA